MGLPWKLASVLVLGTIANALLSRYSTLIYGFDKGVYGTVCFFDFQKKIYGFRIWYLDTQMLVFFYILHNFD